MIELPEIVQPMFLAAGWHPDRRVAVPDSIPTDHPASAILASLGGLTVVPDRKGEECAPDDLAFEEVEWENSITRVWGELLNTQLFGVAEVHHRHGILYIATDGRCFGRSLMHDAFYFEGETFAEAIERSLFGRRSRPMLRPDQSFVTLYGVRYTAQSSETYRYREQ